MLTIEIVTPEKKVYTAEAKSVIVPTTTGEIDILPGHQPLVTQVEPGEIAVESANGSVEHLAIDKGYAEVIGDRISVLTEAAIDVQAIDLSAVEAARERAEQALAEAEKENLDPAEIEQLENLVRFAIVQRLSKQKRK